MLKISPIPALQDNYIWAIHGQSDTVVIVDPGEAEPVFDYLQKHDLKLTAILCTHRHYDHVGGIADLRGVYNVPVYGRSHPSNPHITHALQEQDKLLLQDIPVEFEIWELPGHLDDHIAFVTPGAVFCGDILFGAGCGKIFEGSPLHLFHSVQRLASLPDETQIYSAHEYTAYNLPFAAFCEPKNQLIQLRMEETRRLLASGKPTVPFSLALEKATNPFLRLDSPELIRTLQVERGLKETSLEFVFATLRAWRDQW